MPLRKKGPTKGTAHPSRGVRPGVEVLEDRTLPSNVLLIDFSPDRLPRESQRPGSFAAGFLAQAADGRTPRFLDFNHNGKVNGADVNLAVQEIVQRVRAYFAGYDLSVQWGDVRRNTQLGRRERIVSREAAAPNHVYVIYVGGMAFDGTAGTFGEAYQAPVGYNLEYYGYAFSTSMIRWYERNDPSAQPERFAADVGTTVAHEFGHLLGLGHVFGNPPGDPNPMNYNVDPLTGYFPDAVYPQIELRDTSLNPYWGPQDPAAEIRASLAGQPAYDTRGLIYSLAPGSGGKRSKFEKTTAREIVGGQMTGARAAHQAHRARAWADAVDAVHAAAGMT
jgi:hypothetical protein